MHPLHPGRLCDKSISASGSPLRRGLVVVVSTHVPVLRHVLVLEDLACVLLGAAVLEAEISETPLV